MSLQARCDAHGSGRFPRVSGDEPVWLDMVKAYGLFSPRERG